MEHSPAKSLSAFSKGIKFFLSISSELLLRADIELSALPITLFLFLFIYAPKFSPFHLGSPPLVLNSAVTVIIQHCSDLLPS